MRFDESLPEIVEESVAIDQREKFFESPINHSPPSLTFACRRDIWNAFVGVFPPDSKKSLLEIFRISFLTMFSEDFRIDDTDGRIWEKESSPGINSDPLDRKSVV